MQGDEASKWERAFSTKNEGLTVHVHNRYVQYQTRHPAQGNVKHLRRHGLVIGGMVGRQGDLYYKSKQIAIALR